jgi:hypothetical protein
VPIRFATVEAKADAGGTKAHSPQKNKSLIIATCLIRVAILGKLVKG